MATLPTLLVNANSVNGPRAWGDQDFANIDEGISAADAAEIGDNGNYSGTTSRDTSFLLIDAPVGFGNMTTLSYQIRYRVLGAQTNSRSLEVRIVTETGSTVLAASTTGGGFQTVATGITNTAFENSSVVAFTYVNTTASKEHWDNARLEIRMTSVRNMGGDTNGLRVDTVEFTGTYEEYTPLYTRAEWVDLMTGSYATLHPEQTSNSDFNNTRLTERFDTDYIWQTFGYDSPASQEKTTADFIYVWQHFSSTFGRTNVKTGNTLRWEIDDNDLIGTTVFTQNNLPAKTLTNLGNTHSTGYMTSVTSTDGWSGLTQFAINSLSIFKSCPNFNFPNVTSFQIYSNQFSGTCPNFNFPSVTTFRIDINQFSGACPNFNFPSVTWFDIYSNQFSGTCPNFNFPSVTTFWIYDNQFSGACPNFNFPSVTNFFISDNQFSGACPVFDFPSVQYFYIDNNNFSSSPPTLSSTVASLQEYLINDNDFTGSLPLISSSSIRASGYKIFYFQNNQFTEYTPIQRTGSGEWEEYYNNNSLPTEEVDKVIDNYYQWWITGSLHSGTLLLHDNSSPTSSSLVKIDELKSTRFSYTAITYSSIIRVDQRVTTITISPSGSIYVGGGVMSTFGNPGRTRMAKITSSGSFVSPYSSSVNNFSILSIDSYEDKIYVGGSFFSSSVDFTPTNRIASIDPLDGSHDTSFNVGTGFNSTVNTIKVDGSGKVLAGGTFTTYSGSAASRLARLNVDGTLDTGFNNTITNITPRDIDIDENDKIITVNDITVASSSFSIVRFNTDGSQDATLNSGTGFTSGSSTNTVETVKSDLSGSIYVGGRFIEYSGSARNRVVRLNTDGTIDDDFNVGTGFNRTVWSIEIDNSGKVLVGGEFDEYSGSAADKIIRLNTDGTIDAAFTPPPFWGTYEFSGSYSVRDIEVQSDDKIVLGGYFSFIEEDKVTEHIVRLNSDGSTDLTFFGEEIVIVRSRRLNRIIN